MLYVKLFTWTCFLVFTTEEILRLPSCEKFDIHLTVTHRSKRLSGASSPMSLKWETLLDCQFFCIKYPKCKSLAVNIDESLCELYDSDLTDTNTSLVDSPGWFYAESKKDRKNLGRVCNLRRPCKVGAKCVDICEEPGYQCISNIALLKPTAHSVCNEGYEDRIETQKLVDGDLKSFTWVACFGESEVWFSIDFRGLFGIFDIKLHDKRSNSREGSKNFGNASGGRIMVSNSSAFTEEVMCSSIPETEDTILVLKCREGAKVARFLKMTRATTLNNWIKIDEIEVMGWKLL